MTPQTAAAEPRTAADARMFHHVRVWIVILMVGLVISGVTAFPLREETAVLAASLHDVRLDRALPGLAGWVDHISAALDSTYAAFPFIAYGTDWLAFAHLVIAAAFIGPLRDPIRNIWVLQWGTLACAGIVPLAVIAGSVRGIPLGWQLIDISFAIGGIVPLLVAHTLTRRLEHRSIADAAP